MTRTALLLLPALVLLSSAVTHGQPSFEVARLEGNAKVQRPPKRTWASISADEKLLDNDLVETFFKARLTLRYGEGSAVILGSNSKALLNIKSEEVDDVTKSNLNLTLFGGGILVNNASEGRVEIYTANGVAELDSGTISAVVEPKTGHTGFQVIGGSARVRNVAQKEGKRLNAGQTTVILPGREPTAGLHLTYKHVSVLKHFFGSDYIEREMEVSGIQPTAGNTARSRLSLSRNLEDQRPGSFEAGTYKALFSLDKIYGSILDDREKSARKYASVSRPFRTVEGKVAGGFEFATAAAGGEMYPAVIFSSAVRFPYVGFGLRLPIARGIDGMSVHLRGADGILDKIDYLRFGSIERGTYLYAGGIRDLTFGSGIVVDHFTNVNPYSVYRPLGLYGRYDSWFVDAQLFMADAANFKIGGAHLTFEPGGARIGAGYYFDFNKNDKIIDSGDERFVELPARQTTTITPGATEGRNTQIVELGLDVDIVDGSDVGARVSFAFAQKFSKRVLGTPFLPPVPLDTGRAVNAADSAYFDSLSDWQTGEGILDGAVVRGPALTVEFANMRVGVGSVFEYGRLIDGYFDATYPTNRLRTRTVGDTTYLWPLTDVLSSSRRVNGVELFYGISFVPGTVLDLAFRHDYNTHRVFADTVFTAGADPGNNFALSLSFAMDERVIPAIKYAECYLRQSNGTYFPPTGTYFASWGLEAGLDVLTAPLLWSIALEAGVEFYYLDLGGDGTSGTGFNNQIDEGDRVIEFRVGMKRGFL